MEKLLRMKLINCILSYITLQPRKKKIAFATGFRSPYISSKATVGGESREPTGAQGAMGRWVQRGKPRTDRTPNDGVARKREEERVGNRTCVRSNNIERRTYLRKAVALKRRPMSDAWENSARIIPNNPTCRKLAAMLDM